LFYVPAPSHSTHDKHSIFTPFIVGILPLQYKAVSCTKKLHFAQQPDGSFLDKIRKKWYKKEY
jgi:hypothetical protein